MGVFGSGFKDNTDPMYILLGESNDITELMNKLLGEITDPEAELWAVSDIIEFRCEFVLEWFKEITEFRWELALGR